ncbi:MAG: hypothetical protein AN484_25175 [Aphanizomenon flos-aquae WA102]|uniref:Uncharacterized protein n=1 Tax=Aphanizomenon flos-aquae WA102 TaxID=1710896 RepID=A0A1B7WJC8_APHFL|nr:MAG: hypothetical protein AN484_25175 [Aphanizomenon flos-aquae WA102]
MPEKAVENVTEEDRRERILRVTENDRAQDDDQDEAAGLGPGGPIELLEAREPHIAHHQEGDDQHDWQQDPGPGLDGLFEGVLLVRGDHDLGQDENQRGYHPGGGR